MRISKTKIIPFIIVFILNLLISGILVIFSIQKFASTESIKYFVFYFFSLIVYIFFYIVYKVSELLNINSSSPLLFFIFGIISFGFMIYTFFYNEKNIVFLWLLQTPIALTAVSFYWVFLRPNEPKEN